MLSPYDELPVHQTSYPLSVVTNTDPGFDDGYFFSVFSADHRTVCFQGLRINPNTDIVGGYVGFIRDGVQRTVRFSRTWRELCDTVVGPYRIQVVEPYRDIRLTLDDNPSGLQFDLNWMGSSPAYEEAHHLATNRGRPTTDQTRYSQAGTARGGSTSTVSASTSTPHSGTAAEITRGGCTTSGRRSRLTHGSYPASSGRVTSCPAILDAVRFR